MNLLESKSFRRVISVARKEFRHVLRDRVTLALIVLFPTAQLVLFGYAINQDVRDVPTALVDQSDTALSRQIVGQLEATQGIEIVERTRDEDYARSLLRRGAVRVVLVVPPDFTRSYYRGRGAQISVLVDATDPTRARAVGAAAEGLADQYNLRFQLFLVGGEEATFRAPRLRSSFGAEPELVKTEFLNFAVLNLHNPELRTALFVVPALLGVILTTTMILMTALALVRERERGSFEFLIATPVRRSELMAGKIMPYIGIGFIQILIVLISGLVLFEVPIVGRLVDVCLASLVFIAANLALGLVISSLTSTQYQATQLAFFFFLPSVLLSGFMFPFEAMPVPAQWLGEMLPLTHFIRISRAVLLRGSTLFEQAGEVGAMLLFAIVGFTLATRLFSKRLG